jgi:hypothetical protein
VAAVTHPGVDVFTDQAAVVLQERPIVALSSWLADTIATANRTSRLVQLVTPADSRLTLPLEEALRAVGGRWVVRDEQSLRYFDGLRGESLAWSGAAFLPTGGNGPVDAAAPSEVTGGTVRIDVTVIHPATEELQIGRLAELCLSTLTGHGPTGWGTAEPVTQPWNRAELTAYCRQRAPAPSILVLVGSGAIGMLRVSRRPSGVVERLSLAVGSEQAPDLPAIDGLAVQLADAQSATVRTMLATLRPGRSDATVGPVFTGWPVPYGVLIGPEPIAEHGAEHALAAPAPHVRLHGPLDRPSCWCRLVGPGLSADNGKGTPHDASPSQALANVLSHFGAPGS